MRSDVRKELGYALLTELLAYQFASPVRWIETQDVVLHQQKSERLVEIGPSETLLGMAKKTAATKYKVHDAALALQREYLSFKKHAKELYYESGEGDDVSDSPDKLKPTEPTPLSTQAAKAIEPTTVANDVKSDSSTQNALSTGRGSNSIADKPLSAIDIIVALIAHKLKKSWRELDRKQTIKQLAGGRSTLENEIVGDLGGEFGSVPDAPENMELIELAAVIETQGMWSKSLGKTTQAMVNRLMSSKMPSGLGSGPVRDHLRSKWGLPPSRQSAILLRAVAQQPASRLPDTAGALAFLDNIVAEYASDEQLDLSNTSSPSGQVGTNTNIVVDQAAVAALAKTQDERTNSILELYAKQLGHDLRAGDKAASKAQETISQLQDELQLWLSEHGDIYASGIKPIFAAEKARKYDSFWNWALQDSIDLFYGLLSGRIDLTGRAVEIMMGRIARRSNPKLIQTLKYFKILLPGVENPRALDIEDILGRLITACDSGSSPQSLQTLANRLVISAPKTMIDGQGRVQYAEVPRSGIEATPPVDLKTLGSQGWETRADLTQAFIETLRLSDTRPLSFQNAQVLVIGAGRESIGTEIVCGLLRGGAKVLVTTSNYSLATTQRYQQMYAKEGASGSHLIVVPFNQASQQDIESLVSYIYDSEKGLGWDLDHVIPFAAIPEGGREIDSIDSKSELAHRMMLTNTLRLLGSIKRQKDMRGFDSHPAQVILPLSPNHGVFGGDGLYPESKIALETLSNRWRSESWGNYLSICGAIIGWTRGTGLMNANNSVAEDIEKLGVRTFSQVEMAHYILILMSPPIAAESEITPVSADLSGGMGHFPDFKGAVSSIRQHQKEVSEIREALAKEEEIERLSLTREPIAGLVETRQPKARIDMQFPRLPDYKAEILPLARDLRGMVDLERVVVVTGFSEVGPYGNSRTRWEMEAYGEFSLEGCVEMAWMMGLIKHHNGPLNGRAHYHGWIIVETKEPIQDLDIKKRFEQHILNHSGIRLIEPEINDGYNPERKKFLQEVLLEDDMAPFKASKEVAEQLQLEHGDKVDVIPDGEDFTIRLLKGACLMIPKALRFDRAVAGQIPTGWDARTYGFTDDLINQVDPVTLYAVISTVEALLGAGITDPFEIYRYLHVSEIGNCIGSGLGGVKALRKLHKDRFVEKQVQNDILQESFINTTAAWINMLLLSSTGPLRTPVGACATSLESLECGFESIVSGKAKMCLVGGFDDFSEDVSYEFAKMKATVSSEEEIKKGRDPREMSRPAASTRSGFMESQGSGVQIITSAQLALDMGLPIQGIIAWVGTASDKIGRSVPAPGRGLLTNAREAPLAIRSPMLDISYRRQRLMIALDRIEERVADEISAAEQEKELLKRGSRPSAQQRLEEITQRIRYIRQEGVRQQKDVLNQYGNHFWKNDPEISPLRGALATWNLTIDDLDVVSFHGTSTVLNEKNEVDIVQRQLKHLGRTKGNPALGVFQKYLTGHSKGAAGAWMLNGGLQVLNSGLVPGNRNADNIDSALQNDYIVYPSRSIQTTGVKAFSVMSFGFGQKGAQALGVHPKYLFATLDEATYEGYRARLQLRQQRAAQYLRSGIANNALFTAKEKPPYHDAEEHQVLLDPTARLSEGSSNSFTYGMNLGKGDDKFDNGI
ncbi:fatty acid synthase subunit alpha, putative [Talaromyces stipitatus ATCC 10500]|uniref:Fatty acid synthase subunit alpha n=1 Tax=Talaromyces stipitatus (strain ATCC 10500 / CBS 375.48 / QM 6759 / NRRL 1006) TaxID=441959 RepID=B8LZT4_TALSN|nr:fatty acid synthase subunit alpha, putative [Talaromyces stipitatus ATCC 10500]EED20866.1 fatty acid synthase subunit alpha, putative [Talaromyces stipitatus ATCC 10500]